MFNNIISKLPQEVFRLILIIFIWIIVRFVANKFLNNYIKTKGKTTGRIYFKHVVSSAITVIAVLEALTVFQSTSKLLSVIIASSGLLAIVVGLAAQESLSDIINGFSIIVFRPFEVNDRITLISKDITGKVQSITLRHTIIKTYSNSYITVPNSVIAKEIIENFNLKSSETRSFIDVDVAYDTDIEEAIKIIQDCVYKHPLTVNTDSPTDVFVQVRDFGKNGMSLRANVWTATIEDNFLTCSELRIAIKKEFDKHGIEIPYQKVEIVNREAKEI